MYATIRRYEGVDTTRADEISARVRETLVPLLRELPGFVSYYLIEADDGVLSSLGLFETFEQSDESANVVARWIADEHLDAALPNAPQTTTGEVVAHSYADADAYDTRGTRVQSSN